MLARFIIPVTHFDNFMSHFVIPLPLLNTPSLFVITVSLFNPFNTLGRTTWDPEPKTQHLTPKIQDPTPRTQDRRAESKNPDPGTAIFDQGLDFMIYTV